MNLRHRILYPLFAVCMIALLGGCFGTSPSSRFYTLTPRDSRGISASGGVEVVVRVGPVAIPSYLDRQQIVTRSGSNEVVISEYERWGGTLDDEITRLLVNDIAVRLAPKGISVVPWRSISLAEAPTLYRIPVGIDRFDGAPGETVVLNASWAVIMKKDKQETPLVVRESTITEAVGGKSYDALVAAMGKAVDRLAGEMSNAIESSRGTPAK